MENTDTLIDINPKKKFIALSNGAVIDTNEIMYLSQVMQYGEENHYHYYITMTFKSNHYSHILEYHSVDDAEEDYWLIRHALLNENNHDMVCE